MGDRYIGEIKCPACGHEDEYYYAPTCGFNEWICTKCDKVVNLEEYTGISKEEASNKDVIKDIYEQFKKVD